jgi:pyrroline-5-carboxylate reductase
MMRLEFIGTGRITTALVEGFCTTPDPPASIIVSPRNAEKATQLAVRFRHVTVAKDNQAIVDGCDCVFLALRLPMVSVLGEIRFRPEQRIISLMPTRPFTQITKLVEPAKQLAWALPLPSVARHVGPITIFRGESLVVDLLAKVGKPLVVRDLEQLRILWSSTALISPFYALISDGNSAIGRTQRVPGDLELLIAKLLGRLINSPWRSGYPAPALGVLGG